METINVIGEASDQPIVIIGNAVEPQVIVTASVATAGPKGDKGDPGIGLSDQAQTINGVKTFTSSPIVPTITDVNDNSTKAASTAFVQSIAALVEASDVDSFNGRIGNVLPQAGDYTKSDVGLGNADNTSDANKPVSNATQTALNGKEPTVAAGTTSQYYRGDKTFQTLTQDVVPDGATNKSYTATEKSKLAAITGTNTGDQTLAINGQQVTISGANGNSITLPSSITPDATTAAKGIVQLAGDLGGTAAAPTTPTAVHKTGAETVAGSKTFSDSTIFSDVITLSKSKSLRWNDNSDVIRVDDNPAWYPSRQNVMTFDVYGGGSSGGYAWRDTLANAVRMMLNANTGDLTLTTGSLIAPALRLTTGATNNYFLSSDAQGNATWKPVPTATNVQRVYSFTDNGGKADLVTLNDAAMTAGSAVLTSASATFTSADVGKKITVFGAYGGNPNYGTISSVQSATQVTLNTNATTTVSNAKVMYGTDNAAVLTTLVSTVAAAGGGIVDIGVGSFGVGSNMSANQKNNVTIRGAGRGATNLVLLGGYVAIGFGNADASANQITRNITVSDLTIDMNNQVDASYGIVFGSTRDVYLVNVHIKNQINGAKSMLFWGVNTGATSNVLTRNFTAVNCIFSDSNAGWEAITLAQGANAKFIGCTFRDKPTIYNFLNYGSYDVSLVACSFTNCGNGINGFTASTTFNGCTFNNASVTVQGNNTHFVGCEWNTFTLPASGSNAVSIIGFQQAANEAGWDSPAGGTSVRIRNTRFTSCTFRGGNTASINAGTFNDTNGAHLSAEDITIDNCNFSYAYWQGFDVKADYLTIRNCTAFNNGQLNSGSVKYNYVFAGKEIIFENNRSYDDQATPTATNDYFIDNQLSGSLIPTMNISMSDNKMMITGQPYYYTGSSFTATKPANINFVTKIQSQLDLGSNKVTNLANGTGSSDAVAFGQLAAYAPLSSPAFTNTPTAPTAAAGTNTTQLATTAYVVSEIAARLAAADALIYKGAIDASTNPNYPAADAGFTYKISVAGRIGGNSGPLVQVNDMLICTVDGSASGSQAAVGTNWDIIQANVDIATSTVAGIALLGAAGGAATFESTATRKSIMTQQPTQTAAFTAIAGNFYPINASGGNVPVTLPTSTVGQEIQFKKIDANAAAGATSGIVTLNGTINGVANASIPLRKINQGKQVLADGSGGWSIALGDIDITSLYATTGEPGTVQLANDLGGTPQSPTTPTAVHVTGNETVAGVKTFTSSPVVPSPINNTDASNKAYVDAMSVAMAAALG